MERLKRRRRVKGLVRALAYEDPITDRDGRFADLGAPVREAAAEALAELDGDGVGAALIAALADPEERVRSAAIRALRARRDEAAALPLLQAAATWTAPELAGPRAEALDAAAELARGDASIARRAVALLLERGDDLTDADEAVVRRVAGDGESATEAALDELMGRLSPGAPAERARVMLTWLAPASADRLIGALGDAGRQRDAALALGGTHDLRAVDPLSELLLSAAPAEARAAAAWALGEILHPSAIATLLVASTDPHHAVRAAAMAAFDRFGGAGIAFAHEALAIGAGGEDAGPAELAAPALNGDEQTAVRPVPPPPAPRPGPVLRRLLGRRPGA